MIYLDFETRSAIDLIKLGATRYAMDESTQVLCMSWLFDELPMPEDRENVPLWHRHHAWSTDEDVAEHEQRPDELIERIRSGEIVEAHNARFEFLIWNLCLRREFPEFDVQITLDQLRCSAAKASCLSLPRSLGEACEAVNIPPEYRKDPDGQRLINKLSKPMGRRRLNVKNSLAKFQGIFRAEFLATRMNKDFTGLDAFDPARKFTIAGDINPWVDDYCLPHLIDPHAQIRGMIQKDWRDRKGYCVNPNPGDWYWTDVPIDDSEFKASGFTRADLERDAREYVNPPITFCDEETEHRRNWKYNQQDVRAERALSEWTPEMTERELEYWRMDFRMSERGIKLDVDAATEAVKLCEIEVERLNKEMMKITDGKVQGGSKRIPFKKWANEQLAMLNGNPIPDTRADTLSFALYGVPTKAGDDAKAAAKGPTEAKWADWGKAGAPLHRAMEICLEVNRSSVAKYRQMVASVCPDGRLHDIMLYNGADRTGRWSGKGVQPHNFVRGYMEDMGVPTWVDKDDHGRGMKPSIWDDIKTLDLDYITLVCGEPLPVLAKAARGALTASPGKELYAADFNAIEARKLAWLSGCASQLTLFRTGGDPYCDMATAIYKREITKKDKAERQLGKKAILGLGYAMGWEKFQATVWAEEGIWLDDEFCQMVVSIYRKDKCPEVPALWKATGNAAIDAVVEGGEHIAGGDELGNGSVSYFMSDSGKFLHCRLPSGRLLAYLYPEVHTKVSYRFSAVNERGKPCVVMFPAKVGVPMTRVRYHAEKLAEKQRKTLQPDPPESFLQPHLSFMGRDTYTHQWKRCGTHGGSLVENYDQASSRDLLAESMWRVDQHPDFDLLLSIHDEVIAEAPIGAMPIKEFEEMMAVVPKWAPGMPITAEGWIGPRLRK